MRFISFLQTWSVWEILIVFALCFQPCNAESLADPVAPGSLPPLDDSTAMDKRSAYNNSTLKILDSRDGEGNHEWESARGTFRVGAMSDDDTFMNQETGIYMGNDNPNDNYGHATGWDRDRRGIQFRCGCSRVRVKVMETAWLNIITMLDHMRPFLQRLRQHFQNPNPAVQLSPEDRSRVYLFEILYGRDQPVQIIDQIEGLWPGILYGTSLTRFI
ncbi:hypothetical protein ABOM_009842 [Aspergillus bombycis]|uniref:Uncharacterized protein n=1 Tax=Aspergillus bombycis TaxID=109264 RepID=A0A1F7ZNY2_9EURO|nr:hypothetical protein ABOM_009842 [Aspergillus bombycis]OGM41141.1 hypothetical protein ABOM_009842 [Aspergillus bombycis]